MDVSRLSFTQLLLRLHHPEAGEALQRYVKEANQAPRPADAPADALDLMAELVANPLDGYGRPLAGEALGQALRREAADFFAYAATQSADGSPAPLSVETLRARFGDRVAGLFEAVAKVPEQALAPHATAHLELMRELGSPRVQEVFGAERAADRDPLARMPVVREVYTWLKGREDYQAAFAQLEKMELGVRTHLFQSMVDALGLLQPGIWAAKSYSSSVEAGSVAVAGGSRVEASSYRGDAGQRDLSEHEGIFSMLSALRDHARAARGRGLEGPTELLMDDGGEALLMLHQDPRFADLLSKVAAAEQTKVAAVEQTHRGAKSLKAFIEAHGPLLCAVVNMATSWLKLRYESPMIARSVWLEVDRKLEELHGYGVNVPCALMARAQEATTPREQRRGACVVGGAGSVGRHIVYEAAKNLRAPVHVYDRRLVPPPRDAAPEERSAALAARAEALKELQQVEARLEEELGPGPWVVVHGENEEPATAADFEEAHERGLRAALAHGHVTISCTGTTAVRADHLEALPDGAVIFNAASSNDELDAQAMRLHFAERDVFMPQDGSGLIWARFQGAHICLGPGSSNAFSDTVLTLPSGKQVLLGRNGYVVNMTSEADPIPPEYIQLTRALIVASLVHAVKASLDGERGLLDVPDDIQHFILDAMNRFFDARNQAAGREGDEAEGLLNPTWTAPAVVAREVPAAVREALPG